MNIVCVFSPNLLLEKELWRNIFFLVNYVQSKILVDRLKERMDTEVEAKYFCRQSSNWIKTSNASLPLLTPALHIQLSKHYLEKRTCGTCNIYHRNQFADIALLSQVPQQVEHDCSIIGRSVNVFMTWWLSNTYAHEHSNVCFFVCLFVSLFSCIYLCIYVFFIYIYMHR